jgi:hypothetical protein
MSRARRRFALLVMASALELRAGGARASCRVLRYSFQVQGNGAGALDMAPQIAVWVETPDRQTFVDTLMVTNAVAMRGIGNRPGRWDFPSGPKFPYGRRPMALPIWAHARGRLYPALVMQNGDEDDLMGHEGTSGPDPYFCRPMALGELVDAVTCASGAFRSDKGMFDTTGPASYFPPRGDLGDTLAQPCPPLVNRPNQSCSIGDAEQFAVLDDLDAVATATPAAGQLYTGSWVVPDGLAPQTYAVMVEVGKEFDQNASYHDPSFKSAFEMMEGPQFGINGNLGQPSVVFRVPIVLGDAADQSVVTDHIAGYGDPHGDVGPPLTPVPVEVPVAEVTSTSAVVRLLQDSDQGAPVLGYEVRYSPIKPLAMIGPNDMDSWIPAPSPPPGPPGSVGETTLTYLVSNSWYAVGVRAHGTCGVSAASYARFWTPRATFKKLSGCFIVTAAFDAPEVNALRAVRDRAVAGSALAATAVDLYERSAPVLADLLRQSEVLRSLARAALRPVVDTARDLEAR